MLRQYGVQRHRYEKINGREIAVGTVPIGSIFRLRAPHAARARTYIVEAWLTRSYARADRTGRFSYLARNGHLAQVRDLANGRRALLADCIIMHALEA